MKARLLKVEKFIRNLPMMIKQFYQYSSEELAIAREKFKDLSITNFNLGIFHINKGNMIDAKMRFIFAIKLKEDFALAHYHLARCYLFDLKFDKAKQELQKAMSLGVDGANAEYRLSLIDRSFSGGFIPEDVIKEDFDSFASQYENYMMEKVSYVAPEKLAKAIADNLTSKNIGKEELTCLDLGCGTGLAGLCLSEELSLKSITGVDISPNMLKLAETLKFNGKSVYQDLKALSFSNLELLKEKFDIIISCMSLGYAGDLEVLFGKLNKVALKNSILGLVVLKSDINKIEFNYDQACFSYSEEFLTGVFGKCNWSILQQEEISIFANGTKGLMYILRKK